MGSGVGSKENKALFDTKVFNNPKPEALMKYIIEISTRAVAEGFCDDFVGCQGGDEGSLLNINDRADNADSRKSTQKPTPDLVMDFFAGSGTTCAVAHKMKRRWIGIEQMDYIESITKERLKKVIEGEQGGISKAVGWQGGGSFIYTELMPLNVAYKERIKNLACHTETTHCHTEFPPCHTEPLGEVSNNAESTRDLHKDISLSLNMTNPQKDFSPVSQAQNDKTRAYHNVESSSEKELDKLYKDLESKAFLDYRIDLPEILENKEFKELDLEKKKEALLSILDSNMDYVLYGDIEDKDYAISSEVIELNKIFYGDDNV